MHFSRFLLFPTLFFALSALAAPIPTPNGKTTPTTDHTHSSSTTNNQGSENTVPESHQQHPHGQQHDHLHANTNGNAAVGGATGGNHLHDHEPGTSNSCSIPGHCGHGPIM
ncbi:hypothetical protein FRC15_002124 [Serendipita sp. 397]|nr:hypothetical protein FRC15_002124 [Serendipita sp. 397]